MFCYKKKVIVSKTSLLSIDTIAQRYGCLPSEVKKLSIDDYTFNFLVANQAIRFENEETNRIQRDLERKRKK